jgi:5-methylcytosine-specific restriction endonuclease McrA
MVFDKDRQVLIFEKTGGRCHICRKSLMQRNYGSVGARGAWEVEHSVPRAKGGSDHLNNLYPACIPCNRNKSTASSRSARQKHGFKAAPTSQKRKSQNTWVGGAVGAVAGRLIFASAGPIGIVAGLIFGAAIGHSYEPD